MRVVLYLRVSTDRQTTDNQAVLHQWAEEHGHQVEAVFEEQESAWTAGHQAQLAALGRYVRSHPGVKGMAVWALDRLTREGPLATLSYVHDFEQMGVQVLSMQEEWMNVEDPDDRDLLLSITGYIARKESKRRSDRVKLALGRLKREGKVLGRPPGAKDKKPRKKRAPRHRYSGLYLN